MNNNKLEDEIISSWNKLQRDATKVGFREGVLQGKDNNYQNYFDQGYENGFKNGFILGRMKAELSASENNGSYESTLAKTRQGLCVMCEDTELSTIEDITKKQEKVIREKLLNFQNT